MTPFGLWRIHPAGHFLGQALHPHNRPSGFLHANGGFGSRVSLALFRKKSLRRLGATQSCSGGSQCGKLGKAGAKTGADGCGKRRNCGGSTGSRGGVGTGWPPRRRNARLNLVQVLVEEGVVLSKCRRQRVWATSGSTKPAWSGRSGQFGPESAETSCER